MVKSTQSSCGPTGDFTKRPVHLPATDSMLTTFTGVSTAVAVGAPAHPYQTSVDITALAPKAQSTVFPWREPKDFLEKTIDQVRAFLRSHQPVTQGR